MTRNRRQKVTVNGSTSYFCAGCTDPLRGEDSSGASRILEGVVWTSDDGHIEETPIVLAPHSPLVWDTRAELPPMPPR